MSLLLSPFVGAFEASSIEGSGLEGMVFGGLSVFMHCQGVLGCGCNFHRIKQGIGGSTTLLESVRRMTESDKYLIQFRVEIECISVFSPSTPSEEEQTLIFQTTDYECIS